jgi:hypothetical protein
MTERKCGNCKHFKETNANTPRNPLLRRGLCRDHPGTVKILGIPVDVTGPIAILETGECDNWISLRTRDMLRKFERRLDLG